MYDITFLGNSPVDVLINAPEELLTKYNLKKGDWAPVSPEVISNVLEDLKDAEKTIMPGGSAGNTAYGAARLGSKVAFNGFVGNDDMGQIYYKSLTEAGIDMPTPVEGGKTLVIYVLITPDGERTFITTAERVALGEDGVNEDMIANSKWLYIEGYLFDNEFQAVLKACHIARKHKVRIALTLAASFFVEQHYAKIAMLVRDGIDLYICNEEELYTLKNCELTGDDAHHAERTLARLRETPSLVTNGSKGATLNTLKEKTQVPTQPIDSIVDATGAGDAFAAGFMHAYVGAFNAEDSIKLGHSLAGMVIQQIGGRLPTGYEDILKSHQAA